MDDDMSFPLAVLLILCIVGIFLTASSIGYDNGKDKAIKICIEKPQECKIQYDFIKLQENQK
jgi:hypothetical protein